MTYFEDMGMERHPVKNSQFVENTEPPYIDYDYLGRNDRSYYDTQFTTSVKASETRQELNELYNKLEENNMEGTPEDRQKMMELNYRLFSQSLWSSNIGRNQYGLFGGIR
jgi:hypothetical protein